MGQGVHGLAVPKDSLAQQKKSFVIFLLCLRYDFDALSPCGGDPSKLTDGHRQPVGHQMVHHPVASPLGLF
jgi:hypothetical protein